MMSNVNTEDSFDSVKSNIRLAWPPGGNIIDPKKSIASLRCISRIFLVQKKDSWELDYSPLRKGAVRNRLHGELLLGQ